MQHKHLQFGHGFRVVLGNARSQAAQMTLGARRDRGRPGQPAPRCRPVAVRRVGEGVRPRSRASPVELREGTLAADRGGDTHEIRNTGREPLRTLNVYIPPAYTDEGDELPAGRP